MIARDPSRFKDGELGKRNKLIGMQHEVHRLKILADINDPLIKKRFEDGFGMVIFLFFTIDFCLALSAFFFLL